MKEAILVLEDGSYFKGRALGKLGNRSFGEVVFNTGISGYQEILTDPSYAGQIVTLTYPEIGNYGINLADNQSRQAFASGLIIKNLSPLPSSWRAEDGSLEKMLLHYELSGLAGIDTRALTRRIRDKGAMRAVLSTEGDFSEEKISSLTAEVQKSPSMNGQDLTPFVTTRKPYVQKTEIADSKGRVVVLDFGLKRNMLNLLNEQGFDLHVLPANASFEEVVSHQPDGIFLSNGPGDPGACKDAQRLVQKLVQEEVAPIFGVCLGHQILSIAMGAKTFKLKFGHRGSNHPVKDLDNGRVFITSQNHGFAVDENSLPADKLRITHKSLNDETVEGIEVKGKPVFSVQFHPEACPGPQDTHYLFQKFADLVLQKKA